jgi:UDP-galactopyranose mutase
MAKATPGVSFLGRLATYRYMDMHHVIREALELAETFAHSKKYDISPPVFPSMETL